MKRTVDENKTLLVDGPASVTILSGVVEVFSATVKNDVPMVIREGKRIPFEVRAKAEFDLNLSESAVASEVDGSTIPASWAKAAEETLSLPKPATVMVVGGVDSGKTSLCLYLANRALKDGRKVIIIDADLGQSDIGPPGTIGSCRLTVPVIDPFETCAENVFFVGVTSPSGGAVSVLVGGVTVLEEKALRRGADVLIINTDGWVEGEDAVRYKVGLAKQIKPSRVVGIQEQSELTFLLGALTPIERLTVETPPQVRKRDSEERRLLRELGYKKYLKGARAEAFPLSWARIGDFVFGSGAPPTREHMNRIVESLGATPLYCEESSDVVFVALRKSQWFSEEDARNLEKKLNKKVMVTREQHEEGLLTGLHDSKNNLLGIGVLESIDYERRIIRVYTNVHKKVANLRLGRLKLDKKGKETGTTEPWTD